MNVLLVEDESETAQLIVNILKRSNWILSNYGMPEITVVMNIQQAIAHAHNVAPDVILLDLKLLDSDIRSTIDKIPTFVRIAPVVVLTKAKDPEIALHCLSQGARDFIDKLSISEKNEILDHAVLLAADENKKRKKEQSQKTMEQLDQVKEKLDKLGHAPSGDNGF